MEALKRSCLALAQEALKPPNLFDGNSVTVTNKLEDVRSALESLSSSVSPTVAEYVFFPLRGLLQQNVLGNRQTELLFNILTILCDRAWNKGGLELERAQQLVAVTTFLLSPDPPLQMSSSSAKASSLFKKPASFRASGFSCVNALFRSAAGCGFVTELSKSPTTAQIIALLLDGLQFDDGELQTQLACIEALGTIFKAIGPEQRALVLPSVASKLTLFIRAPAKHHFKAKVLAITCLRSTVIGCIGDDSWDINDGIVGKTIRTESWIKTALEKLTDSFVVVKELQVSLLEVTGSRPELIAGIYWFAHDIFTQCSKTLPSEASAILTEIILLSTSQTLDHDLASQATKFLKSSQNISSCVESGFLSWVQQLPSVLDSPNETRAITTLQSVKNSVSLIGGLENIEALVDAIESSLPLSIGKRSTSGATITFGAVDSLEIYQPLANKKNEVVCLSDLGISLPLSRATQASVASLLNQVGNLGSNQVLELLCDRLQSLKLRKSRSLDAVGLLWIAGCIISGFPQGSDMYDIVTYCFEDISEALSVQESVVYGQNSVAAASHTALACYVLGEAAVVQGPGFRDYLVDLIHPLFSMVGNSFSVPIREQAGLAISKISFACGYSGPMELALDTKDYLVDGISLQLNTLNITPSTPQALASLIYISGASIVPYLDDVFSSLFVLLDHYHGYSRLVTGVLSVFRALVYVVDKSVGPNLIEYNNSEGACNESKTDISDFHSLLSELNRKPEVDPSILEKEVDLNKLAEESSKKEEVPSESAKSDSDDESDEDDENIQDEPDDAVEKWEYPVAKPTYTILLRIAGYCDRLITHESSEIRVAVLQLVTALMPFLGVNKEEFLPLIHKTWPEAVERVFDSETYVVEQSFICLGSIAQYSEGFVASRIEKLWPRILGKYSPLLQKRWPQFAPERRILNALTGFLVHVVEHVTDTSLSVVESALVAYRPALIRGEYARLREALENSKPSFSDLLWLVMLDEPVVPDTLDFHTVLPVYKMIPAC